MTVVSFPGAVEQVIAEAKAKLDEWPWEKDLGKPYGDINGPVIEITAEVDKINPSHYKKGDTEVINLTRHLGFREGNVVKYVSRHKEKNGKEDIIKAMWYLQDILSNDYGC